MTPHNADEFEEPKLVTVEPGEVVLRAEHISAETDPIYETPKQPQAIRPVGIILSAIAAALVIGITVSRQLLRPQYFGRTATAMVTVAKTDVANLATALDAFEIDMGRYPTASEGLNALVVNPSSSSNWNGPYVKAVPLDPWNRPYVYTINGSRSVGVASAGADGLPGTGDDIR